MRYKTSLLRELLFGTKPKRSGDLSVFIAKDLSDSDWLNSYSLSFVFDLFAFGIDAEKALAE